ncbi:beta strand repeat-containing protein, partial [Panacagrimonas perspica]
AAGVVIDNSITLTDADDTQMASATVTISAGRTTGDLLNFTNQNGITGNYVAATGVLTLTGPATTANYLTALQSITFSSTSDDPTVNGTATGRTISWTVTDANSDAAGAATSTTQTSTINVTAVNDAPVLGGLGGSVGYTENAAGVVIDNSITLTDADDTQMASATVTISAGRTTGDLLNFANQNGITGSYNAGTGVLTLTGAASTANYLTALQSITFSSTSDNPTATSTTRTISWAVTDANSDGAGAATSTTQTSTINVTAVNDAPVFAPTGGVLTLVSNTGNGAVTFTEAALVAYFTDVDSSQIGVAAVAADTGLQTVNGTNLGGGTGLTTVGTITVDDNGTLGGTFTVTATDGTTASAPASSVTFTNNATGTLALSAAANGDSIIVASQTGNTTLNGGGGNDWLIGNTGNDTLLGGNGNDVLIGGEGNDRMTGGAGVDQFRYNLTGATTNDPVGGIDVIVDFLTGAGGDQIGISQGFIDFANTGTSSGGTTLAASDYLTRASITNFVNLTDSDKLIELSSSLTTNQIETLVTPGNGTTEAFVLVFNSTTNRGELWFDPRWETTVARVQVATFENITSLAQLTAFDNTNFIQFS